MSYFSCTWNLHGRTTPPLPLQLWGSWLPWSPAKEFTRVYHKLITDSPQWLWDKPLRKLVSAKNKAFFFFLPTRNSLNSFFTSGMFCWCIIETEFYDSEFLSSMPIFFNNSPFGSVIMKKVIWYLLWLMLFCFIWFFFQLETSWRFLGRKPLSWESTVSRLPIGKYFGHFLSYWCGTAWLMVQRTTGS